MASIGKPQGRDEGEWDGARLYAAMQLHAAKRMRLAGLLDERAFHALCGQEGQEGEAGEAGLIERGEAEVRYMPQHGSEPIRYQGAWRTPAEFAQMIGTVGEVPEGGKA